MPWVSFYARAPAPLAETRSGTKTEASHRRTAHPMLCLILGRVGCQFGIPPTPYEPSDPHKIDALLALLDLSLSLVELGAPMDSSSSPAPPQAPARSRGSSNASQRWSILRRDLLARSSSRAPGSADPLPFSAPHVRHLRLPRSNVV